MDYNCVVGRAKEARHSRQYLVSRISSSPSRWAKRYCTTNLRVGGDDVSFAQVIVEFSGTYSIPQQSCRHIMSRGSVRDMLVGLYLAKSV